MHRRGPWHLAAATAIASLLLAAGLTSQTPPDGSRYWPQWRGPLGTGEAPSAKPPLRWSASTVQWQVDLPGRGKSTPVVWGDTIFLTTAIPGAGDVQQFTVLAFNRADGKERWRRIVHEEKPHEGTHPDGTYASGSVLTDGRMIYAYFGSRGLYALDPAGKVVWSKQFGRMQTRMGFGEGNSPALHGDTLVVQWDHEGADWVAALDAKTGRERWRRERDEPTTWCTPHVTVHGGKPQVVVSGTNRLVSYDLATGETLWEAGGLTANVIPTPVSGDGLVIAMSGFRGNKARAIRLADARGQVSGPPAEVWTYDRDTPYVPSPLLYRGAVYFLKSNSGVITSLDAKTGAVRFTGRLEAVPNVYASPVAADGRIYIVGREGTTVVLGDGAALEVLATNELDDDIDASPALVDGNIYLRGAKRLYAIGG
ncbi:MAG TPA: PQQ-binding-like beta-propeller repeat protein [Vicinamibacterales bacterium]